QGGPSSYACSDSSDELLAGKTLEVGHLTLHLLAGGVGGRANTLNAQPELIGVGSAQERFFESDELFAVNIEERLIEGLHAVLRCGCGDGVVNEASLVGVDDAIANISGGDHDFDSGDAAFVVCAANQALGDNCL